MRPDVARWHHPKRLLSNGSTGTLDLMRAGKSAPDALKPLLTADEGRDVRQVAMLDAQGRIAAHTAARTSPRPDIPFRPT
jgi:uncharacterized Ntn-hydrolase superfamily protein